MDRGVNNSEIDELTKRSVITIETQFGQEGLDGDSGLTSKIDMKHVRGAGVFQVSEGIISGLPGGYSLTWSFKMLGTWYQGEVEQDDKLSTYVFEPSI